MSGEKEERLEVERTFEVSLLEFCLSKGHDFKGHHGKPRGHNPVEQAVEIECVAGKGILGDRYFGFREDFKGQITFFDAAVLERIREAFALPDLPASVLRRNVFTRGVDLNELIRREFEIDGVRFEGSEECAPCYWMDQAVAPGAEEFMKGRGGLRARIVTSGTLRTGASTLSVMAASEEARL